jgi:YihY family inner membrane protein
MDKIQRTIRRFDSFQRRHKSFGFPLAVLKKYGDDEADHQAALLAYYGFLAIFPLLLALTSLLKLLIHNNDALREKIITVATNNFPVVGTELQRNVQSINGTGFVLIASIILAIIGARGIADALRGGINHVWQVPYVKRSGFPKSILKSLAMLLIGGLGLVLAPLLSGFAVSVGGHTLIVRLFALGLTLVILFGVYLALVRIALPLHIKVRELVPAAITAAIGLTALQVIGGYIITHQLKHFSNLYGTFALVLGLLYWLHLQAKILFYALEIATVRAYKLWPRALDQSQLTSQDEAAYKLYAERNQYRPNETIDVETLLP